MDTGNISVIGAGSPIVDMLARVSDDFIEKINGEKGGMELVEADEIDKLLSMIPDEIQKAPGGSAANTILGLTKLSVNTAFLGMLGDDENGRYYKNAYADAGGDPDRYKINTDLPTAKCISLITPDSERTMRTYLGAASMMSKESVSEDDFKGYKYVYCEGYLLFNRDLLTSILLKAKKAGCSAVLDLGSFEVVKSAMDILPDLLADYIDIVLANEEEAAAFSGEKDYMKSLEVLSKHCRVATLKAGKEGAFIREGDKVYTIEPRLVEDVKDTTGAGDLWATGFLYGYTKNQSLDICGACGSITGGEVVKYIGASIPDERWKVIKKECDQLFR